MLIANDGAIRISSCQQATDQPSSRPMDSSAPKAIEIMRLAEMSLFSGD
jgi:hypothetical protein